MASMAYLKNRALFFTTSPRTPAKMIPEIQLLGENFTGRQWNKKSQTEFIDLLANSGFLKEMVQKQTRILVRETELTERLKH